MSKKTYLSGPMTGIKEHNYPLFNAVTQELRNKGIDVLNPAENFTLEATPSYAECMALSMKQIYQDCDRLAFLPGWTDSAGATAEYYFAKCLKYPMLDAMTILPLEVKKEPGQATTAVNIARRNVYGHPKIDFGRSSGVLNSLGYRFVDEQGTARSLLPADIPVMVSCVKLSRLVNTLSEDYYHEDSVLDIRGYMNTLEMVYEKEANK